MTTKPVSAILMIEDSPLSQALNLRLLERAGVNMPVIVFDAADTACEWWARSVDWVNVALIILDLNLPRMSGIEMLQKVRNCPIAGRTPIIVMTSSDELCDLSAAHRHGADAYVYKQSFTALGSAVKQLLNFTA